MIGKIKLKFGSSPGEVPLLIDATKITVFVGPNNSGKSKVISEIASQCANGEGGHDNLILENLEFIGIDQNIADQLIDSMTANPAPGLPMSPEYFFLKNGSQVHRYGFKLSLTQPNEPGYRRGFSQNYLVSKILLLNVRNRIDLVNDQGGGDLQTPPISSFQKLFRNDELRKKYSDIIKKSIDSYAVIDPTSLGQLRLRLSPTASPSPEVERGLGDASIAFHNAAQHIARASDGAKAFTGILAEILAGDPQILLMDEPEAFLHPALAFNLGLEIANSLSTTDKRLFVSTHSPQFLKGCIQSGVPINVVRLTYRNGVATARLLPSGDIIRMMRNPLLRSTGVLSALFYESVVVTEADPDRAFYQEINERLVRCGRGIPNCVFLNAQNKQTIPIIIGPLRQLGIPAAGIYDIDFVKDGKSVATRFMATAGIPELGQQGLTQTRAAIADALMEADQSYKTSGGIEVLSSSEKSAAVDYFDQLDAYGAFVVRGGELESWLKEFEITGHGPSWLISMFERLGEDPASEAYVRPTTEDVWGFIDKVSKWLLDPQRKGIPK